MEEEKNEAVVEVEKSKNDSSTGVVQKMERCSRGNQPVFKRKNLRW